MAHQTDKTIHLLGKRLSLIQPDGGFQTSIDAVLLAAACPATSGQTILDLGCGVGAAGLCVATRVPDLHLQGVEILSREANLARTNAQANGVKAHITQTSITNYTAPDRADHVISNPPYLTAGAHITSPDTARAHAMGHVEPGASLHDWLMAAHRNVCSGGSLTLIHRADALPEILLGLGRRFGAIEILPLWPKAQRPAKRVIVRAVKDRQTPSTLYPGLILHHNDGSYTPQAERILRNLHAL